MIGTGVFTASGFLIRDLGSLVAVLLAWLVGGLVALAGALCYGELGAALPRNGGEYQLLHEAMHPSLGVMAGWTSWVVGFSAPMAAAALACGHYLHALSPLLDRSMVALATLGVMGLAHGLRVELGSVLQNAITIAQGVLMLVFLGFGLARGQLGRFSESPLAIANAVASAEFAVALVYVAFAYSGWNAAAYLAGELRRPERTLPRSLIAGTSLVTILYVGLNLVFLASAPPSALAGEVEIGHIAATRLLGREAATWVTLTIVLGLLATVSALMMTGPRVYEAMGEDYPRLRWLTRRRRAHGPRRAIALQTALATALVLTATVDELIAYSGFTLSIFAALTTLSVIVLRRRRPRMPRPYSAWGYPWTPLMFALVSTWMILHTLWQRPAASIGGLLTLLLGWLLYLWLKRGGHGASAVGDYESQ